MTRKAKATQNRSSSKRGAKQSRFRIVKLEERIAPGKGHGNGTNYTCGNIGTCHTHYCF